MYVYIYTYIILMTYIYICVYICVCIYGKRACTHKTRPLASSVCLIYTNVCLCVCMCVCVCVCTYAHI